MKRRGTVTGRPPFNAPSNLIYKVATINPAHRPQTGGGRPQRQQLPPVSLLQGWMTPGSALLLFSFSPSFPLSLFLPSSRSSCISTRATTVRHMASRPLSSPPPPPRLVLLLIFSPHPSFLSAHSGSLARSLARSFARDAAIIAAVFWADVT